MIDKPQQNITLRVCLEDVGTHNKAVLDFFFAKLGQHTFRCVSTQEEANVLIIDYDFPPARQRFESDYQDWQKPAIILSISEVEIDNAIWLAKPLTSRALMDAAGSAQSLLTESDAEVINDEPTAKNSESAKAFTAENNTSLQRPAIKPAKEPAHVPLINDKAESLATTETQSPATKVVTSEEPVLSEAEQALRWEQLCGNLSDTTEITDLNAVQAEDSFFLSSLKDAVRLARQCQQGVLLNFPQTRIYVLPEIHRIFCPIDTSSPEFTALIQECNTGDGGKMHILSTREIHELNDMILQKNNALYDLESFVWSSTLLSAQGLLPRELDPNKAVGLKHWPSLTRLELFPHIMPIAAQWSASASSAFDIAKSLNVPQRYVFSFYNAANTLGLIEMDPDKLITKQSTSRTAEAPRGLFSRLLKRLIGG